MIKLTEEQIKASFVTFRSKEFGTLSIAQYERAINLLFEKLLTTEQAKQLAESKRLSVIKWHKFDANDESTYPPIGTRIICESKFKHHQDDSHGKVYDVEVQYYEGEIYFILGHDGELDIEHVVNWSCLPKPNVK